MYSTPLHLSPGYAAVLGHPVATPGAPPDPNSVSHARTGYHAPPTPSSELSSRLMRLEEKVSLLSPVPTTRASPSNLGIDRRGSDDEASASMRQSLVLEEQSLELEHRDLLLRRARESIVSLSEEVVQLKRGEGRVQSLIEQVSTLSKENENLQEQLQLKSSEAEAAKLTQEKVAAERTELASTRDQLAAEAAAGRGFKELYEQTKTSLTKLQIEEEGRRNAAMARAEALEGDLASTRHEISETTEKCRQLEKTLNEVRGERDRLNAALAQNKSGLIEIARELAVKTNLALAKGTELATAKESLEAHMHELKVWKESSSEMQSDLRALQEKLDAKEEDLSRSRQELSVREQELESVQDEAIRLQEELDKCIRVRDEAVKTEVELRRALIGSDGDIKSLRLEMTEQERRYEQADREIGHLEGLLDEQQGRFSELALDVETLQRERDEAMDLCKDYERSIMLALERIDDACVSHLGGRDELDASANRSPPSKQQGHPPSITGKMNATLDRILRRITGVSKLRRNFLRAAEATQENCLASLDEAHAHVEVLDGRASQAEASLRHLRAAIRQSADRQRSDTNDLKSQLQSANAQVRALTDRLATQQEDANGLRESHEQALAQLRSKLSEKAALLRDAHSAAASATASREVEQREERARRESLERECTALTHELDAVGGEHVSMVTERAVLKERCEGLSAQVAHLEGELKRAAGMIADAQSRRESTAVSPDLREASLLFEEPSSTIPAELASQCQRVEKLCLQLDSLVRITQQAIDRLSTPSHDLAAQECSLLLNSNAQIGRELRRLTADYQRLVRQLMKEGTAGLGSNSSLRPGNALWHNRRDSMTSPSPLRRASLARPASPREVYGGSGRSFALSPSTPFGKGSGRPSLGD